MSLKVRILRNTASNGPIMQEGINKGMTAKIFKPTYLYVKTHRKTGLKYFGKTVNSDPHKYSGSGLRWINHLNKHGYDIETEIIGFYTDEKECRRVALEFSQTHKIVSSPEWANLMEEKMDGGPIAKSSIEKLKETQIKTQGSVMGKAHEAAKDRKVHEKRLKTIHERYGKNPGLDKMHSPEARKKVRESNKLRAELGLNNHNTKRIGISRNGKKKLINPSDLDRYIDDGWSKGYQN